MPQTGFQINWLLTCLVISLWVTTTGVHSEGIPLPPASSRSKQMGQNILFIISDDLKPNLGSYGINFASTPNIDRLAARGVRFSRAYTQLANCGPSRGSFLTGMRPPSLRVFDNNTPLRNTVKDALTLPQIFRFSGFRVFGMGKIGDGRVFGPMEDADDKTYPAYEEPTAFNQNATNCFDMGRPICNPKQGWKKNQCKCVVSPGVTQVVDGDKVPAIQRFKSLTMHDYIDERMGDFAAKRLKELLEDGHPKPFMLIVGLTKPHLPYACPAEFFEQFDRTDVPLASNRGAPRNLGNTVALNVLNEVTGEYLNQGTSSNDDQKTVIRANSACVSFVDRQVGKILDAYDASTSAKRDNTIIILTSDHGFHLGEQGHFGKHTLFESAALVPLIIAPPRYRTPETFSSEWRFSQHAGKVVRTPVELVDLIPTMMDLTGLFNAPSSSSRLLRSASKKRDLVEEQDPANINMMAMTPTRRRLEVAIDPSVRTKALQQIEGKSLRKYLTQAATESETAFALTFYNRDKLRGFSLRTERYRYVQWFPNTGNLRTIKPRYEELYDFANEGEAVNIASSVSNQVKQGLKRLFQQYITTKKAEYLRTDNTELQANEDTPVLNAQVSDQNPPAELGYLDEWINSVNSFYKTVDCTFQCYRLKSAFTLGREGLATHPAVVQALRMALKTTIDAATSLSAISSVSELKSKKSKNNKKRRRALEDEIILGNLVTMQGDTPNQVIFTIDSPDESAQELSSILQENPDYISYSLNEFLEGAFADVNEPSPGQAELSTGGQFPSVEFIANQPPTDPPSSDPPSTPTNAPVSDGATPAPTPETPAPTSRPTEPGETFAPTTSPTISDPQNPPVPAPQAPTSSSSGGLSSGAVTGIAIGTILGVAGVVILGLFGWTRRKRQLESESVERATKATAATGGNADNNTQGDPMDVEDFKESRFE